MNQEGKSTFGEKRLICFSSFLTISKAADTSADVSRPGAQPPKGAGRLPGWLLSPPPSDVFPGWSSCSDETDDFLGPLLLTAG